MEFGFYQHFPCSVAPKEMQIYYFWGLKTLRTSYENPRCDLINVFHFESKKLILQNAMFVRKKSIISHLFGEIKLRVTHEIIWNSLYWCWWSQTTTKNLQFHLQSKSNCAATDSFGVFSQYYFTYFLWHLIGRDKNKNLSIWLKKKIQQSILPDAKTLGSWPTLSRREFYPCPSPSSQTPKWQQPFQSRREWLGGSTSETEVEWRDWELKTTGRQNKGRGLTGGAGVMAANKDFLEWRWF